MDKKDKIHDELTKTTESLDKSIEVLKRYSQGIPSNTKIDATDEIDKDSNPEVINQCPKCEIGNAIDARFCKSCGEKLIKEETITILKCPKCDKEYDDSFSFCEIDGESLEKRQIRKEIAPHKDSSTIIKDEKVLEGISGWLILPAIGLFGNPIINIILYSIGIMELDLFGALFILFSIYLLFPFFKKETIFINCYIGYLVSVNIINLVNVYSLMDYGGFELKFQLKLLTRSALYALIWISYFLKSKRVKNTFIN